MDAKLLNPAEPVVVNDGSYEGYQEIARVLSEMAPGRTRPYSRQLVERWYKHRAYNGFPEAVRVQNPKTGTVKSMFKMDDVERWHCTYRESHKEIPRESPEAYPAHPADAEVDQTRGRLQEIDRPSLYHLGDEGDLLN